MPATKKTKMASPVKKVHVAAHTVAPPPSAPVLPVEPKPAPEVAPVMQPNYLKRLMYILVPVAIVAFLIISVSLTFGNTDAGKGVGVLEGCLILVAGLIVVFLPSISSFFQRRLGKRMKNRKSAKSE